MPQEQPVLSPRLRRRRLQKAPGAFLTIGEVADQLAVEQHVLRFWESKFPQIQPVKRAGGRRYYRPEDLALLTRIQTLLYRDGYTIRGVQQLFESEAALSGHGTTRVHRGVTADDGQARAVVTALNSSLATTGELLAAANEPGSTAQMAVPTTADDNFVRVPREKIHQLVDQLLELRRLVSA
jgi:DNA-binding transcriptional MerR regulator